MNSPGMNFYNSSVTWLHETAVVHCTPAENAVDFIIKHQSYNEIADLRDYPDITEQLIDKLLKNCPNINHLCIRSDNIRELAEECSRLRILDCSNCANLTYLPVYMPELVMLNCSYCSSLRSLPTNTPKLEILHCMGPTGLTLVRDRMNFRNSLSYGIQSLKLT